MLVVVLVVLVVVAVATYLTWIASRLDRLMVRVESLWTALDAQLLARAFAAHELAHQLDDVELHAAARAAGVAVEGDRELPENRLSGALHAALPDGLREAVGRAPALAVTAAEPPRLPRRSVDDAAVATLPECARQAAVDLEVVLVKTALARHFYNDAVRDLLTLRTRRLPRLLHLYGRAQAPSYFEFDSTIPEAWHARTLG